MAVASTTEANYIIRGKFKDNITSGAKKAFKSLQRAAAVSFKVIAVGIAATVAGFGVLLRAAQTASIEFETLQNTLKSVAGSSEGAASEFAFIKSEANRLGLDLRGLAKDYVKLTAASKGTKLQGQATRDIFSAVGEASVVLGLTADQTAGALTAIQQIMSKGVVSAEELRGQLGERLPGAFQIAARSMNLTTQELGKMLQAGELLAVDFLPKFAAELKKSVAGGLADAVTSSLSEINRLKTAFDEFLIEVGNFINGNEKIKEIITGLGVSFKALVEKLKEEKEKVTKFVTEAVEKIVAGFKALLIGTAKLLDALKPVFTLITNSFNGLIKFFSNLPPIIRDIGIIGVLVGGPYVRIAIAAVALITQNFEWLIEKAKEAWNWIRKIIGLTDPNSAASKTADFLGFGDPTSFVEKTKTGLALMAGDFIDFVKVVDTNLRKIPSLAEVILPPNTGDFERNLNLGFDIIREGVSEKLKTTFILADEISKKGSDKVAENMKKGTDKLKEEINSVGKTYKEKWDEIINGSQRTANAITGDANRINQFHSSGVFSHRPDGSPGSIKVSGTGVTQNFPNKVTLKPFPTISRGIKMPPAFAKGIDRVPRDMLAQIHKDEKIIPANEADSYRKGGRGVVMNITISGETKNPKEIAREIHGELQRLDNRRVA